MTHYQYYVTGKSFEPVVKETITSYRAYLRNINKLKKKYELEAVLSRTFGAEQTAVAVRFKEGVTPDEKIWKRRMKDEVKNAWWPRANTTAGKAVLAEFEAAQRWDARPLQKAVGHPGVLFFGSHAYAFNTWWNPKTNQAVFTVPLLPPHEKTPKDWYTPVKGVRPVSFDKAQVVLDRKLS